MPYIMYYSRAEDAIVQVHIENGTPLDAAASELGIIAMSMDEFPGINLIEVTTSVVSDT